MSTTRGSRSPSSSSAPRPAGDAWPRIIGVPREPAQIGHHRGPSSIDILFALTARQHRLTVLRADDDFGSVAKVCPDISMPAYSPDLLRAEALQDGEAAFP